MKRARGVHVIPAWPPLIMDEAGKLDPETWNKLPGKAWGAGGAGGAGGVHSSTFTIPQGVSGVHVSLVRGGGGGGGGGGQPGRVQVVPAAPPTDPLRLYRLLALVAKDKQFRRLDRETRAEIRALMKG